MDALEEHLRETVANEVAHYRRNILPIILARGGGTSGDVSPSSTSKEAGNINDVSPASSSRHHKVSLDDLLSPDLWEPAPDEDEDELYADNGEEEAPAPPSRFGFLIVDEETKLPHSDVAAMTLADFDVILHRTLDRGIPKIDEASTSEEFAVSLQVALTKFSRKPYVRYASVRAPQIVEFYSDELRERLLDAYLSEKRLHLINKSRTRSLACLGDFYLIQLEGDMLSSWQISQHSFVGGAGAAGPAPGSSTGNDRDRLSVASASTSAAGADGSAGATSSVGSDDPSPSSEGGTKEGHQSSGAGAGAPPPASGGRGGASTTAAPDHNAPGPLSSKDRSPAPTTGAAAAVAAAPVVGAGEKAASTMPQRLKSISGDRVKVRSLLSCDDKFLKTLIEAWDVDPVVHRIRNEAFTDIPLWNEQKRKNLVDAQRKKLLKRINSVYVSEVVVVQIHQVCSSWVVLVICGYVIWLWAHRGD